MKYKSIGDAVAGMLDQTRRGMTDHEYELHLRRIKRYANDETETGSDQYAKWADTLAKYRNKLDAELNKGL